MANRKKINFIHPDTVKYSLKGEVIGGKRMVGYTDNAGNIHCSGKGGVRKVVPMSEVEGNN